MVLLDPMQISAKTRKTFTWMVPFQVSDDERLTLVRVVAIDASDWDEYKKAAALSMVEVEVELEINGGYPDVFQKLGHGIDPGGISWFSEQIDGRSDPKLLDHLRAVGFEVLPRQPPQSSRPDPG
jgi:hypothetical protein